MEIFLEPRMPPERINVKIENSPALQKLLNHFGFVVEQFGKNDGSRTEIILLSLAHAICQARGLKFRSILESRQKGTRLPILDPPTEFLILGHSRITEELAKLSILLHWPTRIYGLNMEKGNYPSAARAETALPDYAGLEIKENSYVLIASHHKGDAEYIRQALEANAAYIGMVASEKRANLVMDYLIAKGKTAEELQKVRSPAGIKLNCKNPSEIALSIIAELLAENETYGKDKRSS